MAYQPPHARAGLDAAPDRADRLDDDMRRRLLDEVYVTESRAAVAAQSHRWRADGDHAALKAVQYVTPSGVSSSVNEQAICGAIPARPQTQCRER
jgi:hypothetical protein